MNAWSLSQSSAPGDWARSYTVFSGGRPRHSATSPNWRSRSMSATCSPRCARQTERFVDVSVLPVPPFGPRTQTSREFSLTAGVSDALLAGHELVDLEADLLRRRREHDDVVCAGLERAPEEAVGRPVPEHHHVQLGVLAGHRVQEQQGAVRVAGAGDEEQVGDAVAQPRAAPPRRR